MPETCPYAFSHNCWFDWKVDAVVAAFGLTFSVGVLQSFNYLFIFQINESNLGEIRMNNKILHQHLQQFPNHPKGPLTCCTFTM